MQYYLLTSIGVLPATRRSHFRFWSAPQPRPGSVSTTTTSLRLSSAGCTRASSCGPCTQTWRRVSARSSRARPCMTGLWTSKSQHLRLSSIMACFCRCVLMLVLLNSGYSSHVWGSITIIKIYIFLNFVYSLQFHIFTCKVILVFDYLIYVFNNNAFVSCFRKIIISRRHSRPTRRASLYSSGRTCTIYGTLISPSSWSDTRAPRLRGPESSLSRSVLLLGVHQEMFACYLQK